MGLLERARSLNIVSAKTAKAAGMLVKVKMLRADPPELQANFGGDDPDPDNSFDPTKAQIDNLLARAETLIEAARTELGTV